MQHDVVESRLAEGWRSSVLQGYLAHETPPPQDPTVSLCLETYSDPLGGAVSYDCGAPIGSAENLASRPGTGDLPLGQVGIKKGLAFCSPAQAFHTKK